MEAGYLTRTFNLGHRDLAQKLRERAARVWNDTRDEFYRNKGTKISEKDMKKRIAQVAKTAYALGIDRLD